MMFKPILGIVMATLGGGLFAAGLILIFRGVTLR